MKVIARIKGENQKLLESLCAGNISSRLVKNAIVVDLPKTDEDTYGIPDLLNGEEASYFIECFEEGGRKDKNSYACLISDKASNPMRPYYIPKTVNSKNKEHAYFAVPMCVLTKVWKREDEDDFHVSITECAIEKVSDECIILKKRKLWEGVDKDFPDALRRFKRVLNVAREKAGTDDCNTAFYVQMDK